MSNVLLVEKLVLSLPVGRVGLLCEGAGLRHNVSFLHRMYLANAKLRILCVCSVPGFLQGKSLQSWLRASKHVELWKGVMQPCEHWDLAWIQLLMTDHWNADTLGDRYTSCGVPVLCISAARTGFISRTYQLRG